MTRTPRQMAALSLIALLVMVVAGCQKSTEPAATEGKFEVEYKLADWKTKHLETQDAADKEVKVLRSDLGCEVRTDSHDGHFDVSYRCPEWKTITLPTDEAAHEWMDLLADRGFETRHQD